MVNLILNIDHRYYSPHVLLLKASSVEQLLQDSGISYSVAKGYFYRKIYCFYPFFKKNERSTSIHIELIGILNWLLSRFVFSKALLKHYEADIIHLNSLVLTDFLHSSHARAKTVLHVREIISDGRFGIRKKVLIREIDRYCDQIIAISHDNAKHINLPQKTIVLYNHLGSGASDITEVVSDDEATCRVLFLGGADLMKGFDVMVDSLECLDKGIVACFGGNYPTEVNHRKYLSDNSYRNIIDHLVKLSASANAVRIGLIDDVFSTMRNVVCIVAPATIEHFQRPILEAYSVRRPVIASDLCGIDEIVFSGVTGLLVPPHEPQKLAEAINHLCKDKRLSERMGLAGYNFFTSKIRQDPRMVNDIYRELY